MILSKNEIQELKEKIIKIGSVYFGNSTRSFIEDSVSEDKSKYAVAVYSENGCVAGFLILLFSVDDAELIQVAVKEQYRGRGIGEILIKEAVGLCRKEKKTHIFLEVRESNEYAIRLYLKTGFEKTGVRKKYYAGPIEDAVIMKAVVEDQK